jgi:hypothetical protein
VHLLHLRRPSLHRQEAEGEDAPIKKQKQKRIVHTHVKKANGCQESKE